MNTQSPYYQSVDYSRYYLKNYLAYNDKKNSYVGEVQDMEQEIMQLNITKDRKQKKQKRTSGKHNKNGVFITVIILLCFLITAASAELLTNNYLTNELFSFKRANIRASYYALVGAPHNLREDALPEAILVRQGGGASYILEKDAKFYVIYNVYLDKDAAKAVEAKNKGTNIMALDINKLESKNIDTDLLVKLEEAAQLCESTITALYTVASAMEKQEINIFDAQMRLGELKTPILHYKQSMYSDNIIAKDRDFILLQVEMMMGSIDSTLAANPSPLTFLSDLRYIQMNIIRVYQNLFRYYPNK